MKSQVYLADGKYVVTHENGDNLQALRYGQPWRQLIGDGLVLAMAQRIEELEANQRQPMQPVVLDHRGVARFRRNGIVTMLLESHPSVDMNTIAVMNFSQEEQSQFAQLIGYSVSGYSSLSYAEESTIERAEDQLGEL